MTPRDYAELAQAAYDDPPDIGQADSASRAIVRETADGLVVAFRGSDDEDSWIADFDAIPIDVPGIGLIHEGFWNSWRAIAVDVLAAINGRPVTLVGHSLGGAIALAAAADMMNSGIKPAAVYGFEAPRISPTPCIDDLLKPINVWLCRNASDPVPEVPLLWYSGAPVKQIGRPAGIIPDVRDHLLTAVVPHVPAA